VATVLQFKLFVLPIIKCYECKTVGEVHLQTIQLQYFENIRKLNNLHIEAMMCPPLGSGKSKRKDKGTGGVTP